LFLGALGGGAKLLARLAGRGLGGDDLDNEGFDGTRWRELANVVAFRLLPPPS